MALRVRKDRMSSELDRQGLLDIFIMEAAEAVNAPVIIQA